MTGDDASAFVCQSIRVRRAALGRVEFGAVAKALNEDALESFSLSGARENLVARLY